jgi:hypothetical protein
MVTRRFDMVIHKYFAPLAAAAIVGATVCYHAEHLGHVAPEGTAAMTAPLPRDLEGVDAEWPLVGRATAAWSVGALTATALEWPCERWTDHVSAHKA